FSLAAQNWLLACGYQYCWRCRMAKQVGEFMPSHQKKRGVPCRACNTERVGGYWKTHPEIRRRRREWQRTERGKEVMRMATQRWRANLSPEKKEAWREQRRKAAEEGLDKASPQGIGSPTSSVETRLLET